MSIAAWKCDVHTTKMQKEKHITRELRQRRKNTINTYKDSPGVHGARMKIRDDTFVIASHKYCDEAQNKIKMWFWSMLWLVTVLLNGLQVYKLLCKCVGVQLHTRHLYGGLWFTLISNQVNSQHFMEYKCVMLLPKYTQMSHEVHNGPFISQLFSFT